MPPLLSRDAVEEWLARLDEALLAPTAEGTLVSREVSLLVNDVGNDGRSCSRAPARTRQLRLV